MKDKPFLLMESSPSFTNWQPVSKQKKPGIAELAALQTVAHGADSVLYFQWRASRGAEEKLHGAVIGHDGREDARSFTETAQVGQELEVLAEITAVKREKQAAIVHDWQNKWALEGSCGPRNAGMGYWDELKRHYNALAREGIAVEFVDQNADLTGYGLVVVPMLYLLTDAFAKKLCAFAQSGGTVIATYWSGVVDESDLCRLGDTPYGLTELLGLRRTEIDGMYDGETRRCVPSAGCTLPAAQASTLCEVAVLDEKDPAEPLSLYDEDYFAGHPAAAVHRYGKGRAYYLASRFDEAFYRAFYHDAAKEIGLSPAWPEALPGGVLAVRRGSFVFVQNCTEQPATVGNTVLDRYRTAVWKDMNRIF